MTRLRQWLAVTKTDMKYFFTSTATGHQEAMAIACAMFGVSEMVRVEDNGTFGQEAPSLADSPEVSKRG